MVPIHKLMKLPRHQSLRKICKIFTLAEQELVVSYSPLCKFVPSNLSFPLSYLQEITDFLVQDPKFSENTIKELVSVKMRLDQALSHSLAGFASESYSSLIRSCNSIRHILLTETGQQTADWDFIDHSGNLDAKKRTIFTGMKVFLEDIRSPFNVGSMFRSAESFGVKQILLSPLCSDPNHPRAQRTAMGCVSAVPWQRIDLEEIESPLFVLETGGTSMNNFDFPLEATMIVGSEELGASPKALERAEKSLGRVTIETFGAKGSLNAGTAFGIALQAWAAWLASKQEPRS